MIHIDPKTAHFQVLKNDNENSKHHTLARDILAMKINDTNRSYIAHYIIGLYSEYKNDSKIL